MSVATKAIVTATGVKMGSKGKVANTVEKVVLFLSVLSKGEARVVRKMLHAAGMRKFAAATMPLEARIELMKAA